MENYILIAPFGSPEDSWGWMERWRENTGKIALGRGRSVIFPHLCMMLKTEIGRRLNLLKLHEVKSKTMERYNIKWWFNQELNLKKETKKDCRFHHDTFTSHDLSLWDVMMTYWKKPQMQIIWNLIITVQRHAFPIDGRDDNIIGLISVCKQERVNRKKGTIKSRW